MIQPDEDATVTAASRGVSWASHYRIHSQVVCVIVRSSGPLRYLSGISCDPCDCFPLFVDKVPTYLTNQPSDQ